MRRAGRRPPRSGRAERRDAARTSAGRRTGSSRRAATSCASQRGGVGGRRGVVAASAGRGGERGGGARRPQRLAGLAREPFALGGRGLDGRPVADLDRAPGAHHQRLGEQREPALRAPLRLDAGELRTASPDVADHVRRLAEQVHAHRVRRRFRAGVLRRSITTRRGAHRRRRGQHGEHAGIIVGGAGARAAVDHLVAHRVLAVDRPPAARARGQQQPNSSSGSRRAALGVGEQRAHGRDVSDARRRRPP